MEMVNALYRTGKIIKLFLNSNLVVVSLRGVSTSKDFQKIICAGEDNKVYIY
jgi:hypothetical protein